ncbi:hypothetical protein ABW16_15755 [Mycolicibacter heraklionensis]|uniref:Uncharacterized protein n=1 Tax=Mycolicibacter heraklionensis TaxID=512402 RepID=A0A9X7ZIU9_9MYCO|nr:hypothetical protein [Mycolicibacter heraklionensis]KLO27696.1 hypothetical protein ABW16_15755 [Mycolicibacter heraklionensis]QZA08973.1 hypothetical protein K3U94_06785 [Mycolicibacter heraklionensis]
MNFGFWGVLTVLAAVLAVVFAGCALVYVRRLEDRTPAALGEEIGAHKAVLAKVRKRQPLTQDEFTYAHELVADARSPLAYAIPAVIFFAGLFYIVGCLHELDVHGGNPSFRTFIGGFPMLGSLNMLAQFSRVARLKSRLEDAVVL